MLGAQKKATLRWLVKVPREGNVVGNMLVNQSNVDA